MEGARRSGDSVERICTAFIRFGVGAQGIDICEACAAIERKVSDGSYGIGDGDARQAGALIERIFPDAGDGLRDGDARQACAARERRAADAGDGGGDGGSLAASNECVARSLNDSIAVIAGVILRIASFYLYAR